MNRSPFVAIAPLLLISTGQILAQTAPDAGALRQQIERGRESELPRKIAPDRPAQPAAMKPLGGTSVTVKRFVFAGNTLLTTEQLMPTVANFLNRPLDFNQLQGAVNAVAEAYRKAGWVVRTYLPAQDIVDGVVTIQIVEAVFGGVKFEGNAAKRIAHERIGRIFDAQQGKGLALNTDDLDRALLLADDLPGVTVVGSFRAGTGDRETDLVVKTLDEALFSGEAVLDNTGSRSTGSERLNASAALHSAMGLGDSITGNVIHTQGSDYARLGFTLPVGYGGWRVGANVSRLDYQVVGTDFALLKAKGSSASSGLEASYPIVRSRLQNLVLTLSHEFKSFDNQSGGATTSKYKVDTYTIGLNGNLFDNLGGGGANTASLNLVSGKANLDGSPNQAADAATTRVDGRFMKLSYHLSRQQVITDRLALYGSVSGQAADRNLDSSEKFYLGGANGVRAYPANEGGGSEGVLATLELRWRLPEGFILTGFYDGGQVKVNRQNSFVGAASPNRYDLAGAGLSLGWQTAFGLHLKAIWARRLGNNPNPTATGKDQDGSLDKDRIWLSASMPF